MHLLLARGKVSLVVGRYSHSEVSSGRPGPCLAVAAASYCPPGLMASPLPWASREPRCIKRAGCVAAYGMLQRTHLVSIPLAVCDPRSGPGGRGCCSLSPPAASLHDVSPGPLDSMRAPPAAAISCACPLQFPHTTGDRWGRRTSCAALRVGTRGRGGIQTRSRRPSQGIAITTPQTTLLSIS